jgi:hemerythrin-like domain-containing protein
VEPGSYETDTSGMARIHLVVESALETAPTYVNGALTLDRVIAVASFYENVIEYLRVHHGAEDELLFPRLEERCAHEREAVMQIGSQHHQVDARTALAIEAIDQWRAEPNDCRARALIEALTGVLEALSPHCRAEEAVVVPLASRYVSPAEWHEMLPYEERNYRLDKPWVIMGLAMDLGGDARRAAILAVLPESSRVQWINEWSQSYEAFMAKVRP